MPTGMVLTPPSLVLADAATSRKTPGLPNIQANRTSASSHELELLFSPPALHAITPSIHLQSVTDREHGAIPAVPQTADLDDEYTLSAYGDISLGEVIVPPLPATRSSHSPLQPRFPQPRLRLKVRRPPMPKCGLSYTYLPDPLPHDGDTNLDERWPGSPRPFVSSQPWLQHQPLVPPLTADSSSRTRGNKPFDDSGSSLEKLFDRLLPSSPSIRLSPPGSPASQALDLPQETYVQKSVSQQGRDILKADAAAKVAQSSPIPAPRQGKSEEAAWRTRLPPRPPIPKWDM